MKIEDIREKVQREEFELGLHAHQERQAEEVTIEDVKIALLNGEIIEEYPDDPRGESCLVLGRSKNRFLHSVCGWKANGWLFIITVYIPQPLKWIDERTRRKRGEENDA